MTNDKPHQRVLPRVRNPNGIADDYMSFHQLASPFTFRLHPIDRVKTQNWSIVYAPYCTEIRNNPDAAKRDALQLEKWRVDTEKLHVQLAGVSNSGGNFPRFRDVLQSHCASVIGFADADIHEQGLELRDFIASVLDGTGPVLDASESDTQADRAKPRDPLYWLINNGKDVFSRLKELIGGVFG